MPEKNGEEDPKADPKNVQLRHPGPNVVDQRQQQIDPAGRQRVDWNARSDKNRKQPGNDENSPNPGKRPKA